ncbi:MAG: thiamine pyrophosphate-dependent dehydrogenase E1 component subunit alpha [Acidobacteriota bacterium]|nr:thiamine pyrophosphate-dependent dehydrogenase E1 component subunit alpha [Blastocatellia bacterium]MDW8238757.1 thiamine pyrophosphate-dependent dehydrogenase E1 component subunit alpha [Acidobacteriota bacterium]
MKRYPAYDPPEYVNWTPDPEVMKQFRQTIRRHPQRWEIIRQLSVRALLDLYRGLLRHRLHEIALFRWVKQGIISKAWLGTGEEAVTIGAVHALNRERFEGTEPYDYVLPMIRNGGACHEMGMPMSSIFKTYLGTGDSPSRGRDVHLGDVRYGVIPPISHIGDMVPVAAGIALGFKYKGQPRVALTWIGDGGTKTGAFHEGMCCAAAFHVPLIVIVQNNQIALGTRLEVHHKGDFMALHKAYGFEGAAMDGNNVLDVYAATKIAADHVRSGGRPYLLVAETFRMGGHATHDVSDARRIIPPEEFAYWGKRDPIGMYETYLIESHLDLAEAGDGLKGKKLAARNAAVLQRIEAEVEAEVEAACQEAQRSAIECPPNPDELLDAVYSNPPERTIYDIPIWEREPQ